MRMLTGVHNGLVDGFRWIVETEGGMIFLIAVGVTGWVSLMMYLVSS